MVKNNYQRLAGDTVVFAVGNMLTKLMQFFLLPMYTALLTTEQYGIGELVNNMSELLYPVACLGIYEGMFRFSIDRDLDKRQVFTSGTMLVVMLLPVICAVSIAVYAFTGFDYTGHLTVLCLLMAFRSMCMQFAKGMGYTRLYAISGVIGTVSLCVSGYVLLGWLRMGTNGYLVALMISQIVQLVCVCVGASVWKYLSHDGATKDMCLRLLKYSLPLVPNALAWWSVNLSARYIVLFVQGASEAGLYTAASKLPAIMNMFVMIFQQAWQIFSAREHGEEDEARSFSIVFRVFSSLLLCSGAVVVALTLPLSSFMLKGDFLESSTLVPSLMFGAVISGYSAYFGTIYNAAMQNSMVFISTLVGALVSIAVGIVLVGVIGVWGPIAGVVLGYGATGVMRWWGSRTIVPVEVDVMYNAAGLIAIFVEVIVLTLAVPHSIILAFCIAAALIAFSLVRYRAVFAAALKKLRG